MDDLDQRIAAGKLHQRLSSFGFTRSKIKGRPRRGEADIVDTKGQVEEALYRNAVERRGHFAAFGQPARSCRS
jgi:hypothetical protein